MRRRGRGRGRAAARTRERPERVGARRRRGDRPAVARPVVVRGDARDARRRLARRRELSVHLERRPRVRGGVAPLLRREPVPRVRQAELGPRPVEPEGPLEALALGVGRVLQQRARDVREPPGPRGVAVAARGARCDLDLRARPDSEPVFDSWARRGRGRGATRPYRISSSRRRRRDSPPRSIQLAAAAARLALTEYPARGRGGAATRPRSQDSRPAGARRPRSRWALPSARGAGRRRRPS